MPETKSNAQVKKQLSKAIKSLTFCHAQAPGAETAQPYASVVLYSGKEVVVDIVSPGASGMSPAQLVTLFDQDQRRKSRSFSHPEIEGEDEAMFGSVDDIPLHANDLLFEPETFIPSGIEKDRTGARYCLLARKGSTIVGMVSFNISVNTYASAELGRPNISDMLSIYFDITLDLVYVCTRHRNKGYGKALMAAVADVFRAETHHLSKQLVATTEQTGELFELHPIVNSEWVSRSGKLSNLRLLEELDLAVDEHNDLYSDIEPERQCLKLSYAENHACY